MSYKIDRNSITVGSVVGLLLAIGIAITFWPQYSGDSPELLAGDIDVVRQGATIYAKNCASCHGKNLEGQSNWRIRLPNGRIPAPPHNEAGHTWHHSDALLFRITKLGPTVLVGGNYQSDMPAYAGILTDDEIVAVLSYIKSTWPPVIKRRQDAINKKQR